MDSQAERQLTPALLAALTRKVQQALALHQQGHLGQAEALYREVLQTHPRHFDALHFLGIVAGQRGQGQAAVELFSQAIAINPCHAATYADRGIALQSLGRHAEALVNFDRALALQPDYVDALNNRGIALQRLGRYEEALDSYCRALSLRPDNIEATYNRGSALQHLGRHAEAMAVYEESLVSYDRTLALRPDYAEVFNYRAITLRNLGRHVEALSSFDRAIAIQPDYVEAHWYRGLTRLLLGDFAGGWAGYEWRLQLPSRRQLSRSLSQPRWRGEESLSGKTIFVYSEQGLGDTLQFCRYARLLADRGARVVLEVQPILKPLLGQLDGVSALVGVGDELPAFDCHSPLLSLPLALQTDLESIPAAQHYLVADAQRMALWKERLGVRTRPRIGLVWAGNPRVEHDFTRTVPLDVLAALAVPGMEFLSLQKDLRPGDREFLAAHPEIRHLGAELSDFADTAAVIANLDLVITVDTVIAHLSGALGQPVWILQAHTPDFRWLLERDDSPWYPSVRLFRQPKFADWDSVIDQVQLALLHDPVSLVRLR